MDIERADDLVAYLRERRHVRPDESPRVTVLAGGVSNRTVLVERDGGEAWVLKQALEKLRVKADWFCSPARIEREALGLRWLRELAPPGSIPRGIFEDRENHLLAMDAVPQPHENWKTMLLRGEVDSDHVVQFGRLLGSIHRGARARRAEIEPVFTDASFFESLRLEPYYAFSADRVPAAAPFLRALIDETRGRRITLVHGDYSPKNILVREGCLVLLDHEVIHWGDPAFDLGFSLTHFLSKAHHRVPDRAKFADAARLYWESYGDASEEPRAVRHTLGCLLARVAGRSPLEYLDERECAVQRDVVVRLMADPPRTVSELTKGFLACL